MTLEQIKQAVDAGNVVHWSNEFYTVKKVQDTNYLIVAVNGHAIGLTWQDGVTLNGNERDFYIKK
jgi:hypothetical protein